MVILLHETGECSCSAGFKDDACNATCPEGRFGLNCEETCECQKTTTTACDPVTGECLCHAGYRGVRCETQCPKGRYGPECRSICHCENDGSCNNLGDCYCQRGWTGELCEDRCETGNLQTNVTANDSFVIYYLLKNKYIYRFLWKEVPATLSFLRQW